MPSVSDTLSAYCLWSDIYSDYSEIISSALSDIHSDMPSDTFLSIVIYSGLTWHCLLAWLLVGVQLCPLRSWGSKERRSGSNASIYNLTTLSLAGGVKQRPFELKQNFLRVADDTGGRLQNHPAIGTGWERSPSDQCDGHGPEPSISSSAKPNKSIANVINMTEWLWGGKDG